MKRSEFIKFYTGLNNLNLKEYDKFFLFAISSTKTKVQGIVDEISKKENEFFNPEFVEFQRGRINILKRYAKLENGNVVVEKDQIVIDPLYADMCTKEVTEYINSHNDLLERQNRLGNEYDQFLNEEVFVDVTKISIKYLPSKMSKDVYDEVLKWFIKETPEEFSNMVE